MFFSAPTENICELCHDQINLDSREGEIKGETKESGREKERKREMRMQERDRVSQAIIEKTRKKEWERLREIDQCLT